MNSIEDTSLNNETWKEYCVTVLHGHSSRIDEIIDITLLILQKSSNSTPLPRIDNNIT